MGKNNYAFQISGLSKNFKEQQVLKKLSLNVTKGSFHVLIGENGAGKTTLIKSILSLFDNSQGSILINNINYRDPKSREGIFYMEANVRFPSFIKLKKYLYIQCALVEKNKAKIKSDIIFYLKKFNLWKLRNKYPTKFSSGQKKKAMLILALLYNANIFILDEPTANLDPNTRKEIYQILLDTKKEGKTIFVSTHNLAEISQYVDEASFIFNGQVFWNNIITKKDSLEKIYFKLLKNEMDTLSSNSSNKGGVNG